MILPLSERVLEPPEPAAPAGIYLCQLAAAWFSSPGGRETEPVYATGGNSGVLWTAGRYQPSGVGVSLLGAAACTLGSAPPPDPLRPFTSLCAALEVEFDLALGLEWEWSRGLDGMPEPPLGLAEAPAWHFARRCR